MIPKMSEYWDPAWKQPTFIFNQRFDPVRAAAEIAAGVEQGFKVPEGQHEMCVRADGLVRHATVGPDYTVLVAAEDRLTAADLQKQIGRLTLYFIATRPRIRAVPDECGRVDGSLRLVFESQFDDGSTSRMETIRPVPKDVAGAPIDYEGNGAVLLRTTPDGQVVRQRAGLLAQELFAPSPKQYERSVFDLDLQYVGRSRGRERETCALDRLKSHKPYQQVLEEVMSSPYRNREVWLILASGTTMDIAAGHRDANVSEADILAGTDTARTLLTENDRIDLTEALLINYFRPRLNDQHTGDLDLRTGLMSRWRRANITGVTLSFSTNDLRVAVRTEAVPATNFHGKTVCL